MRFIDKRILRIQTPEDMVQILEEKGNPLSQFKKGARIQVYNKMEQGRSYVLQENPGKGFDPEFTPEVTPAQMLTMGVFEGKMFNDCLLQFPAEWFAAALKKGKLSPQGADPTVNYFGVKSRLSLQEWRERGWAPPAKGKRAVAVSKQHPILSSRETNPHIRGWAQWYFEYWCGARNPELDQVQIARWKAFRRHAGQIRANCKKGDLACRPVQRQALLQWAYRPTI